MRRSLKKQRGGVVSAARGVVCAVALALGIGMWFGLPVLYLCNIVQALIK